MNEADSTKGSWAAIGGLVGVVLVFAGMVFESFPEGPGGSAAIDEHVVWFSDRAHMARLSASWILITIGVVLLLCGLALVRVRLETGGMSRISGLVLWSAGVGWLLVLLIDAAMSEAVPAATFFEAFNIDTASAQTILILSGAGYILTMLAAVLGSVTLIAVSSAVLKTRAFPGWMAWIGYALAAFGVLTAPISETSAAAAPLLWFGVAAVFSLTAGRASDRSGRPGRVEV